MPRILRLPASPVPAPLLLAADVPVAVFCHHRCVSRHFREITGIPGYLAQAGRSNSRHDPECSRVRKQTICAREKEVQGREPDQG